MVFIYSGKILKDTDTLEQHQIKDGHTIHLVIKSASKPSTTQAASTASPTTTSTSTTNTNQSTRSNSAALPPLGMGISYDISQFISLNFAHYTFFW